MSRGPDVTTLLERALFASAEAANCPLRIVMSQMTRWASATFAGARHELSLAGVTSPELDAWLAALPEAEFALRGHLVAEVVLLSMLRDDDAMQMSLEVLTVEDR